MKRYLALAIVLTLLSFTFSVEASVGYSKEGVHQGAATDINIQGNSTFDGSKVTIIANGHKDGVTENVSTETNLTSAALAYGTIRMVGSSTAIKYLCLANGSKGQIVTIMLYPRQGYNIVIGNYAAGGSMTKTGWDTITFDTSTDTVTLWYVNDTSGWVVIGNNGCTVATVLYPG